MALNTEALKTRINLTLAADLNAKSFMTELGAQPIATNVTHLVRPVVGGPSLIGEGGAKKATSVTIEESEVTSHKLVHMVRYTDELERTDGGKDLLAKITTAMVDSFGPAFDAVVAHGTDPSTGTASPLITSSLSTDAKEHPFTEAGIDLALNALAAEVPSASGLALSPEAFSLLASLSNTDGSARYNNISYSNDFMYRWFKTRVSEQVSKPGIGASVVDSNILAILGDYRNIVRSAEITNMKVIDAGNPDGGASDLGNTNEKVLRLEMFFRYAIVDGDKFVLLKKSA